MRSPAPSPPLGMDHQVFGASAGPQWREALLGDFAAQQEGRARPQIQGRLCGGQDTTSSSLRPKGILLEPLSPSAPAEDQAFLESS